MSKFKVCQTAYISSNNIQYEENVRAVFTHRDDAEKWCSNLNWENSAYMVRNYKVVEVENEN